MVFKSLNLSGKTRSTLSAAIVRAYEKYTLGMWFRKFEQRDKWNINQNLGAITDRKNILATSAVVSSAR